VIFFSGCAVKRGNKDHVYFVPTITKKENIRNKNEPPPPPPPNDFYLPFDFIIDSSGEVFYYQQPMFSGINDVIREEPELINLRPKDIVRVPDKTIAEFIKLNILSVKDDDRFVAIGLLRDSIKSVGLTRILNVFEDTSNHIKWLLRKATKEEAIVLDYKKRQLRYYPGDIKWDSL
jgi:hypothetical protein